jgi:hypothetical protein
MSNVIPKKHLLAIPVIVASCIFSSCFSPTDTNEDIEKQNIDGVWQESGTKELSTFTAKEIQFSADSFFCEEFRYSTQKLMVFTLNGMEPADCDPNNGTYYMAGIWDTLNGEMRFTGHYTDSSWYFSSEQSCPEDLVCERTYTYTLSDTVLTFTTEKIGDDEPLELDPSITLYRKRN